MTIVSPYRDPLIAMAHFNTVLCGFIFVRLLTSHKLRPRGDRSSKDMASSRNLVSTIGALASPKMGDETRCPEG